MRKPLSRNSTAGTCTLCLILGYCSLCISKASAHESQWEHADVESQVGHQQRPLKDYGEFVQDLFKKYGRDGVITLEGFEILIRNLGIGGHDLSNERHTDGDTGGRTFQSDRDRNQARASMDNNSAKYSNESPHLSEAPSGVRASNGNRTENLWERASEAGTTRINDVLPKKNSPLIENNPLINSKQGKCLSSSEILASTNRYQIQQEITPQRFLDLCPVLVYEIDQRHCDNSPPSPRQPNGQLKMTEIKPHSESPNKYVWFYSILAVLVISVTGMLSVAIVPIIRKYFYQKLLQFLVALAIGSLIGDALLHLLPHAMKAASNVREEPHNHNLEHQEHGSGHQEVWLGLTALAGIGLFFCAEQLLNFLNVCKKRQEIKKRDRLHKNKLMEHMKLNHMVGEKLSKYSYSSYGCHHDEETLQELNNIEACMDDHHNCFQKSGSVDAVDQDETVLADSKCLNTSDLASNNSLCGEKQNGTSKVKSSVDSLNKGKSESSSKCFESVTVIVSNMDAGHHHGHGHNHACDIPRTASATAWMVIAGDGLHNFSDGMAIGAAFASSITGGLSTSIAVFCHELPHELGDFALLLKAGMATRQALLYNGLSSVLCFLGMLVGLAIGNIHSANAWVFAAAAGMFIYIALVDMMPELNSETGEKPLVKFAIQFLGMSIGATIMCLIALYEHDLQGFIEGGS